jgi:hypothetical protein
MLMRSLEPKMEIPAYIEAQYQNRRNPNERSRDAETEYCTLNWRRH